ncbi:hypothetical protein ND925_17185 [Vibrio diabolicus]|uniref:hypothetical protein n=1 Tax=Vibrio diabolicus TaxID=50719 RepID=UPI00215FB097|nr:hypothetical protein [Vibrio diabolicus]MCS0384494.1 hypothetical protein [Vibrio diabolicus]MDV5087218.1 hypothetical protein [Vibrio diabolicus]
MDNFSNVSESVFSNVIKTHQDIKVELSEELAKFAKEIPNVDFTLPKEVPPSSIIHSVDVAAQILVHTNQDQEGKYIRVVASVYWANGKIYYTKHSENSYVMHITWPKV